jgi:heat shock protein HslJ
MKKLELSLILILIFFYIACTTSASKINNTANKSENMKANPIDGTWETDYIMNSPKALDDLYPKTKPTISFLSHQNQLSGYAGCNNFNGKCTVEGNKLQIGEALALTRKICPDMVGEQTFLETLKKVNTYSVTNEGKTLNLIMGDIAVMRLNKKQTQNEK